MGCEYQAVGGMGIRVTKSVEDCIKRYFDNRPDFKLYDALEDLLEIEEFKEAKFSYIEYGDAVSEELKYALIIDEKYCEDIFSMVPQWVEAVNTLGILIYTEDLENIIELLYI